ncbi:unnamed protein product [Oikopleura dioica]|uniref:Uncharacterized protein n=1 Tax=Oikopleura dioica TaxID=34765 RepID=E4X1N3_OIKDI|nr:unnamed protein product [Oikopleura dioica]CBY23350.1 unnamed protein product [Oikopleura dioica]CBY42164.1 unnamed protein product [Oikopleura dioica]
MTRKTTTTTNKSTKRASTKTPEIISTTNLIKETAFQFSKSFNISKSRNSDENCSKFCEQRFLQSKFNEFASKWADLAKQENSMRSGKVNRKTTAIKKAIDHRERNFKCRSNNLIPAKVFKVKCCEKLSINEQDEKETIKVLCSSIVKFYEFTDENCAQKTWIFRLKRFCDRLTA